MAKILTFHEALKNSETAKHRHLLLGNGFSIACRPDIFVYGKLFERANFADNSRARKVFDALGTSDFERVIRALRDYSRINPVYAPNGAGAQEASLADADALREVLVRTIASSHPERPADIAPAEYECCKKFLSNFERIFTLNYDLLLYWALMQDGIKPEVKCDDGFRKPDGGADADYVSWEPENIHGQNIYYLHGALHVFDAGVEIQKYTWVNTGVALIDQIRDALNHNFFPLFVAEGTSAEKMQRIKHSDFLSKAYRSFIPIQGALFLYGHSLSEADGHILRLIAKGQMSQLYVSIYGDPETASNKAIMQKGQGLVAQRSGKRPLSVYFFDAKSAQVWK
jgi:hypothetical protein